MGMSLGMIGMMGGYDARQGLGGALTGEAAEMGKREDEQRRVAAQKDYQQWLLEAQKTYDVQREQRAEASAIRTDERNWRNEQDRAPTKAKLAAEADVTKKGAELDFEDTNGPRIAASKKRIAEATRTDSQKAEDESKADYYKSLAEATRDGTRYAGKGGGTDKSGTRLEPDDEMEYKSLGERAKSIQGVIDKARGEPGGWDPEKNPGQKQLQSELAAAQLRQRAILAQYREGGSDDPLGIRKRKGGGGSSAPGMAGPITVQAKDGTSVAADIDLGGGKFGVMKNKERAAPSLIDGQEPQGAFTGDLNSPDLKAAIADIKDPKERANAQAALTNQRAPLTGTRAAPAPAPAQASAERRDPSGMTPPPLDRANPIAVLAATNRKIEDDRAAEREREAAERPTREEYAEQLSLEKQQREARLADQPEKPFEEKLASLRERIKARAKRQMAEKSLSAGESLAR